MIYQNMPIVIVICVLGVRVIPELPQPGNAGNGWQFPGGENLTVCQNMEPWHKYCDEPPCGQVTVTNICPTPYSKAEEILSGTLNVVWITFEIITGWPISSRTGFG